MLVVQSNNQLLKPVAANLTLGGNLQLIQGANPGTVSAQTTVALGEAVINGQLSLAEGSGAHTEALTSGGFLKAGSFLDTNSGIETFTLSGFGTFTAKGAVTFAASAGTDSIVINNPDFNAGSFSFTGGSTAQNVALSSVDFHSGGGE